MTTLAKLASAWTAAWSFLALPPPPVRDDDDASRAEDRLDRHDREEADLRVLMSHWF